MTVPERIIRVLNEYAPLPLTYDDLADEARITRKHAQHEVCRLAKAGRVRRDGGRGRTTLIYAKEAL